MINLFQIVNNAILNVSECEEISLFTYAYSVNNSGILSPYYNEGITIRAHSQSENYAKLEHGEQVSISSNIRVFYLLLDDILRLSLSSGSPISPLSKEIGKGGDLIKRADNTLWLVTEIIDEFISQKESKGWVCIRAQLQENLDTILTVKKEEDL